MSDLIVKEGNDLRVLVNCVDQDGAPFDVSAADEIQWAVASSVSDPGNLLLEKTLSGSDINITNDSGFYFDITGINSDALTPGSYYHEAVLTTSDLYVYKLFSGSVVVEEVLINGAE